MTASVGSGGDLSAQVARWAAGGEQYDVEFKGERRERLNDRDPSDLPATGSVSYRRAGGLRGRAYEAGGRHHTA